MNKKDLKKLRKKKISEINETVKEKKLELAKIMAQLKVGKESSSAKKRDLKKDVAQIKTIIREKELTEEVKKDSKDKNNTDEK